MVANLRETTRANQQQDWLKTNLARIAGLMQGHRDLMEVARLIMSEVTPLASAQYGAFYLAEEHDGERELVLKTGYGVSRDQIDKVRFRVRRPPRRPGRGGAQADPGRRPARRLHQDRYRASGTRPR